MPNNKLKCRHCDSYKARETMLNLNGGNYCDIDCATSYGREKGLKAKRKQDKQKAKEQKAQDRKALEELKSLNQLIAEAQKEVNRYVRFRDGNKPCISCDAPPPSDRRYLMNMAARSMLAIIEVVEVLGT